MHTRTFVVVPSAPLNSRDFILLSPALPIVPSAPRVPRQGSHIAPDYFRKVKHVLQPGRAVLVKLKHRSQGFCSPFG